MKWWSAAQTVIVGAAEFYTKAPQNLKVTSWGHHPYFMQCIVSHAVSLFPLSGASYTFFWAGPLQIKPSSLLTLLQTAAAAALTNTSIDLKTFIFSYND